jgi:hypothetical protein
MDGSRMCTLAHDRIAQLHEARANLLNGHQAQWWLREAAWKEGSPRSERDGADLDDDLVEQIGIVELPCEITTADNPEVLVAGRLAHSGIHRLYVPLNEGDGGSGDRRELPVGEDPRGLGVGPRCSQVGSHGIGMAEHPRICARAHRERAYLSDECRIARLGDGAEREEPLQGVIICCDEAVETGGRVVLGFHAGSVRLHAVSAHVIAATSQAMRSANGANFGDMLSGMVCLPFHDRGHLHLALANVGPTNP